jgi:hypothetical protein
MILSWHSDRNTISSDHSIFILHLNLAQGKPQTKRHWANADWFAFSQIVEESNMDLSNLSSELESLKACANVHNIINNEIEAAVIQPRSKYAIWWTKELSEQRRYLLKLERILRTHQNDLTLVIKCQKLRRERQASVRAAKHCYLINKLETTDRENGCKTIATRQTHLPPTSGQTDFQSKADALRLGLFQIYPTLQVSLEAL